MIKNKEFLNIEILSLYNFKKKHHKGGISSKQKIKQVKDKFTLATIPLINIRKKNKTHENLKKKYAYFILIMRPSYTLRVTQSIRCNLSFIAY